MKANAYINGGKGWPACANAIAAVAALLAVLHAGSAFAAGAARRGTEEKSIGQLDADSVVVYRNGMADSARLREECAVLSRIVESREAVWRDLSSQLESRYGMTLSQNYSYSEKDQTLYLVLTNGVSGSSPQEPVLRAHRAFISDEDAQRFVNLVAERSIAADRMNRARVLRDEQAAELSAVEAMLRDKFGVLPDGEYRFDEETSTLFAIVPLPTLEERRLARAVEEQAVRDARERARAWKREAAREKAEAEAKAKSEAESRARAEKDRIAAETAAMRAAEAKAKAEADAARAAAEAQARAEKERLAAEKKAKAEAEKKAKAEAEAKAKAAEAKARAEREARERVEQETAARIKAEAEAKARAEKERLAAEKKAKVEAEKKAKAEAEAKARAKKERIAAEKKAKAEAEAKAKAEAEAKPRA